MPDLGKILIVDDHPIVLDGLVLLLNDMSPRSEIITATDGSSACAIVDSNRDIDWIFMDVFLPDVDGIDLLTQFDQKKTTANVVVLSGDSSPSVIDRALKHSACGFLSKSFERGELQSCINAIKRGQIYLAQDIRIELKIYRESLLVERQNVEMTLSNRQREILQFLAKGYSNRRIAKSFNITESTVKSHVHSLMELFEANNRTHCVSEAIRLGII